MEVEIEGTPPRMGALLVANHRSYIDIAVLGAQQPMLFLAKAEVAEWPVVGYGARRAHILFVKREDPASRAASRELLRQRLSEGVSVTVFPEGTSTRGPGVLPFRPGSFQIVSGTMLPVVPVAIQYEDPEDAWYGDASFLSHFLDRFGRPRLKARVAFGPPLRHADPRQLREQCERWVAHKLALWEGGLPAETSRVAAGGTR